MTAAEPDILATIAAATDLREGREGVLAVLRAVFREGPLPLRDLARLVRMPLPVVGAVRRELETAGVLARGGGVALTRDGRQFCEEVLALAPRFEAACPVCSGAGIEVPASLHGVLHRLEAHLAEGPRVDVTLDQAPCTAETALRRALAMHEAGALEGRRILILGDDDSMSIALALLAREIGAAPRRILALELDPARVRHLRETAERESLPVEVVPHDLRDPLPEALRGSFDVFETDPPYTVPGMRLFVSRGLEGMAPQSNLPGFLSFGDLAPGDQLDLQGALGELGLAVMRVRPGFNRYGGASILGSAGQLIDLRTTRQTRPDAAERMEAPIYTGEIRPRVNRYICRNCSKEIEVGPGQRFATIDRLKEAGCPSCGHHAFARRSNRPAR